MEKLASFLVQFSHSIISMSSWSGVRGVLCRIFSISEQCSSMPTKNIFAFWNFQSLLKLWAFQENCGILYCFGHLKQFPPKNVWQQQKRKQELDTPFHLTSTLSKAASLLTQTFIKTTRLLLPEINRKTFQDKKKNVHVNWIAKSTVFVCITSLNVCAQNQSSNSIYTANA